MTLTLRPPRHTRPRPAHRAPPPPSRLRLSDPALSCKRLARLGALLLIATGLLFCHGCHGDEDNELSIFPSLHNEKRERGSPRSLPSGPSSTQRASGRGTSIGAGWAISPMGSGAFGLRGSALKRSLAI
jgi:hypothetical protein